ncbi:MAG: S-adenosylmethionine:tRNA ribosyltransferase-isomerase [Paramuribaculum sp.]|nr:S-adenosylmethionine:tRNA ribosyltransferase-isomerase [Paramuribaculum sp.]
MNITDIKIKDFNYPLPDSKIAKHPLVNRDECLLLVRDSNGALSKHIFNELPDLLPDDAMLVYNNTKVINARLRMSKASGATIEIFCLEPVAPSDYALAFAQTQNCSWLCFVGNSKRWKSGDLEMPLVISGQDVVLTATRVEKQDNASIVQFSWNNPSVSFSQIIEHAGEIPIPPYLNRATESSDTSDYQTVFSHIEGSVAAPTAGLHFTDRVLGDIDSRQIPRRELTLHVGAGTFQPVKSDTIGEHLMHSEFISVSKKLIEELAFTDRKVFAVGTTSVRTLESLYHIGCMISQGMDVGEVPQWYPYSESHPALSMQQSMSNVVEYLNGKNLETLVASTRIIIAPGYDYKVVKGMVTNFHQPQSTLLLLVSAFTKGDWKRMYEYALENSFRFLSYGDACLLL